jgi:hypothetical protein
MSRIYGDRRILHGGLGQVLTGIKIENGRVIAWKLNKARFIPKSIPGEDLFIQ